MDKDRFDALAKSLITATSRRRTLGGLLGGTLGLLGLADPEDAWSAKSGKCKQTCDPLCEVCKEGTCRNKKKKNGKRVKVCKKGKCTPKSDETRCSAPANGICQNGACTCPEGLTDCFGSCRPTFDDPSNCGTCGNVCAAPTSICAQSRCCKPTGTACEAPSSADPTCCSGGCAFVAPNDNRCT